LVVPYRNAMKVIRSQLSVLSESVFSFALSAMLLVLCASAEAQQAPKISRVGVLGDAPRSGLLAFRQGLRDLGWVEGQNVATEYRPQGGHNDLLPGLAAGLVQLKADVILAPGTVLALAAKQATRATPIVMFSSDPVATGLVTSLARPGGNVTGLSTVQVELGGKRLELLKEAFPKISRVAVLLRPGGAGSEQQMKEIEIAARSLQIQVQPLGVEGPNDFERAFSTLKRERATGLITVSTPFFNIHKATIVELAASSRLPAIYPQEFAEAGGLMSYGTSYADLFRRAATYVDKILKGARPADLPVEQSAKFELVINLKTAKQLGLTIPPNVLARADRVIK
jgi:putative tryptophan/tyrosine transport system substrate-binding protein